jgi:hypothetical protein
MKVIRISCEAAMFRIRGGIAHAHHARNLKVLIIAMALLAVSVVNVISPVLCLGNKISASATATVTVRVAPWYDFKIHQERQAVTVTSDDLARGYVDIPGLLSVTLRSNDPRIITFTLRGDMADKIFFREQGKEFFNAPGTLEMDIQQKYGKNVHRKFDGRLVLNKDEIAGERTLSFVIQMIPQV